MSERTEFIEERLSVGRDERRRDTTVAFNRLASLLAEAYGEEGLPAAPYALRLAFSYAIDVALGIVPWPSEEATRKEAAIRAVLPSLAEGRDRADTRLIAAAPDLLAALKEVAPYFNGEHHPDHPSVRIVNTAIAKAEGRTPAPTPDGPE